MRTAVLPKAEARARIAAPSRAGRPRVTPDTGARAGLPIFLQRMTARPRLALDPAHAAYEHEADRVSTVVASADPSSRSHPVQRTHATGTIGEPSLVAHMLRQRLDRSTEG